MRLRILPLTLAALACAAQAQNSDVRTRQLWDTSLLGQRPLPSAASPQTKMAPTNPVGGLVGITLWKLRPSRSTDRADIRALIHEDGKTEEWTPERIPSDATLQPGDRIRISVESGVEGYLYIIDRDEYADATKGDAYLIFPTTRIRRGDNRVKPGVVIQIPAAEDDPSYFEMKRSRADQLNEVISVLVSPKPIAGLTLTADRQRLRLDQISSWENQAQTKAYRLEAVGQVGKSLTVAEKQASLGKSLTQADPLPQTMYRVESKPGDTLLVRLPLKIASIKRQAPPMLPAPVEPTVKPVPPVIISRTPTPPSIPARQNVEIERYPTIESPSEVSAADKFTVQVSLTKERLTPAVRSENAGPGTAISPTGALRTSLPDRDSWKIDVVLSSSDFELAGGSDSASILLTRDGDSTPALFRLHLRASPSPPRSSDIRVTYWFEGRYLARAVRSIGIRSAVGQAPAVSPASPMTPTSTPVLAVFQPEGVTPDITVYHTETLRDGKPFCQMIIASRIRPPVKVDNCRSSAELSMWLATQYMKVAAASREARALIHPDPSADSLEARALMRGMGEELGRVWTPREFWDVFRILRGRGDVINPSFKIRSIQIFTDTPLMPWELVIPPGSGEDVGFLGTDYDIARWHVNPTPSVVDLPPGQLVLERIDVVAPAYKGAAALPSQQDEVRTLQQMRGYQFSGGSFLQVSALMRDPPQGIVHFAGHGGATGVAQGVPVYSLALEDRVLDLVSWRGMAHQSLQRRPLYFFNACDLGQADNVFSNFVDGWAPAALDSGASGFIGGIWPLNDKAAAQATQRFYNRLNQMLATGPASVATLVRDTRQQFFQTGDPTYLAYVFYGDVNLKLVSSGK